MAQERPQDPALDRHHLRLLPYEVSQPDIGFTQVLVESVDYANSIFFECACGKLDTWEQAGRLVVDAVGL